MRSFLEFVLDACRRQGIDDLAPDNLADFLRIRYGGTNDAKRMLGPIPQIRSAFFDVQGCLFR